MVILLGDVQFFAFLFRRAHACVRPSRIFGADSVVHPNDVACEFVLKVDDS